MEIPPPDVFDFERQARRQGPISEETLTGAVTMEHRGLAEEMAAADTAETELQALSAPMPGLESGVVGFEDVAHLSSDEEMAAPVRSDLPVRVVTGMVLAALLLGSLWVGGQFFAGFVGLLVMLGLGEFYGSLRRQGYQPLALFGFLGGSGLLIGTWFFGPVAIPVAVVATTVLSFFYYAFAPHRRDALTNGGLTVLGMLWVTGTAAFAFPIAASPDFRVLILAVAAAVIATDVGAFFAGRAWGARPMAPVLSPRKTWEGLAGGVVLGIGAAVAAGYFFDPIGMRAGAALGLVVAIMAPLGDLAESMVKRSLGIKDMGATLPGHGGILDRVDAFLFVLPAAWVLFETMGLLR
jgi:phosphatidate cytidylyltransferase